MHSRRIAVHAGVRPCAARQHLRIHRAPPGTGGTQVRSGFHRQRPCRRGKHREHQSPSPAGGPRHLRGSFFHRQRDHEVRRVPPRFRHRHHPKAQRRRHHVRLDHRGRHGPGRHRLRFRQRNPHDSTWSQHRYHRGVREAGFPLQSSVDIFCPDIQGDLHRHRGEPPERHRDHPEPVRPSPFDLASRFPPGRRQFASSLSHDRRASRFRQWQSHRQSRSHELHLDGRRFHRPSGRGLPGRRHQRLPSCRQQGLGVRGGFCDREPSAAAGSADQGRLAVVRSQRPDQPFHRPGDHPRRRSGTVAFRRQRGGRARFGTGFPQADVVSCDARGPSHRQAHRQRFAHHVSLANRRCHRQGWSRLRLRRVYPGLASRSGPRFLRSHVAGRRPICGSAHVPSPPGQPPWCPGSRQHRIGDHSFRNAQASIGGRRRYGQALPGAC